MSGGLPGIGQVTLDIATQRIAMTPFGTGNTLHCDAALDLVTLADAKGNEIDRLVNPRALVTAANGRFQQLEHAGRPPRAPSRR
jgi:hypothetical protein